MPKPTMPPKKSSKPMAPPKKAAKEKVEHQHAPLPVVQAAGPLDRDTVKERLDELGIKYSKKDDDKALRRMLDDALKEAAKDAEAEVAADPDDCFGKPHMRLPTDPDCKRCPDFAACGKVIDKLAASGKGVVANADEEAIAEEEAEQVDPEVLPKDSKRRRAVMEKQHFITPASVEQDDIDEYEVVYFDEAPKFDGDFEQEVTTALYKKRPTTVEGFMKVMGKLVEVEENEAYYLASMAEAGVIRIAKKQ